MLLNDGSGHFREVSVTHVRTRIPIAVFELADLDGDGDLDLVGGTTTRIYENLSNPGPARR